MPYFDNDDQENVMNLCVYGNYVWKSDNPTEKKNVFEIMD